MPLVRRGLRGNALQAVPDVTLDADGDRVMRVHFRRRMIDVHDGAVAGRVPQVGMIFHQVIADADDDIGVIETAGDIVVRLQPRAAQAQRWPKGITPLAMKVLATGMLRRSANSASCVQARARTTPLPARIRGWRALADCLRGLLDGRVRRLRVRGAAAPAAARPRPAPRRCSPGTR